MDLIEKLQYDYTKLAPEARDSTYEERLNIFKLTSLQRRFERYKILYVFKILNNLVPNCGVQVTTKSESRTGLKIEVPWCSDTPEGRLKEQSFQVSGPSLWNTLPISIRNLDTDLLSFKTELDKYLDTLEDNPRTGSTLQGRNSLKDILSF